MTNTTLPLLLLALAATAASAQENRPWRVPLKTGNLSVDNIIAAARGEAPPPLRPFDEFAAWRAAGIDSVEDYQCLLPLEPTRGGFDWTVYRHAAAEAARHGLKYSVYPWLHFTAPWVRESELWAPMVHVATGQTTFAPSPWSPRTDALFDHYYRALHEAMGDSISAVYVSLCCDYGELGYPVGMADWVVPAPFTGHGFWCGDDDARADFRARMLAAHGGLAGLNARWGTAWTDPAQVTYPVGLSDAGADRAGTAVMPPAERAGLRRRWLDFAQWYIDSQLDFAARAVAISRQYFPDVPHEIKVGFASERVDLGVDYGQTIARSATDGYTVRSTHGKLPLYFYRRFSTPAKFHGRPLVTEPPHAVSRAEEVERFFKDATSGTTEYFDYPQNVLDAVDLFARYGWLLGGQHSLTQVAFLYPTTDARLRTGQDNPPRLVAACDAARELFDWDLLDEGLVAAGALDGYRLLILPEGDILEEATWYRLRTWLEGGGWLLTTEDLRPETVEGAPIDLLAPRGTAGGWEELLPVVGQPAPAVEVLIGREGDTVALGRGWSFAESGHYEWGGELDSVRKRWTAGPEARINLPVEPGRSYELAIDIALHPKRLAEAGWVTVGGQEMGRLEPARVQTFRATLTPALLGDARLAEIGLHTDSWRPAEIDGTDDARELGLAVRSCRLWLAGTPEPEVAPPPVIVRELDPAGLAPRVRRIGAGGTIVAPADAAATALTDLAAALLAADGPLPRGTQLDVGAARDGVWAAVLDDRLLFYNRGPAPVTRAVTLDPTILRRLGAAAPPTSRQLTIEVPPVGLATIELPSGEVLLP